MGEFADRASSPRSCESAAFGLRRVGSVDPVEYSGPVWNLTVRGSPTFQTRVGMSHNTQKPVALPEKAIRNSCPPDGLVFEPFCGSGSTLIASARLGRRCYAVELDPAWVDVVRKRWGAWCRANDRVPGKDAL